MNTRISLRVTLFVSLIILAVCCQTSHAQVPVILRQWAVIAGNSDSTFKSPIVSDEDYTYVATTSFETPTGFNILIVKYDKEGRQIWAQTWSGPGNGMDQPSDMAESDSSLYICGITYTSSANNYDFVTLRVDKGSGAIMWDTTFNGSASSYDVATAIDVNDDAVYVTGTTNGTGTSLDYTTIKYNKTNGAEFWHEAFDYNGLMDIAFAIEIKDDSDIVVTGGSQNSTTDWDYQTIEYDDHGNVLVSTRASGTGAGFDRAQAAKSDAEGNIYVTGATVNNSNYDIETVKITAAGMVAWQYKKDFNAEDDLGNDLIVDGKGNVYVCGQTKNSGSNEFIVMKLDSTGHEQWSTRIGGDGRDYIATKMCFDSWGNIIATGSSPNPNDAGNTDFFTVGFDTDGNEIWRDNYDGADHGNDKASDITADANGNIFVTGQAWISSELQTVTIRYRTDYYTEPAQIDSPSMNYLFYPNSGQIVDTNDNSIVDSVHYYTLHHFPQLYFGYGVMNMVWAHTDLDTATQDTVQRVDVSFLNSSNVTEAYPVDEQDSAGYLNYFLAQCPNGITNVYGNSKLLYTNVYNGINAMYTSNNAGLKFYFICAPNCDNPNQVGLLFQGQDSISINQNWELEIHTALGNYSFEKPRVYLLDNNNNVTSLSWHLNWTMPQTNQAQFSGWGTYDASKTLVIEVARVQQNSITSTDNLTWSTYYGGIADYYNDMKVTSNGKIYLVGVTSAGGFPTTPGVLQGYYRGGDGDAIILKFDSNGIRQWATYLGGTDYDEGNGIDVDNHENVYLTGKTMSRDFPVLRGATGAYLDSINSCNSGPTCQEDMFITKLDSLSKSILWSTYYGGDYYEEGGDKIKIDHNNHLYVVGGGGGSTTPWDSAGTYNSHTGIGLIGKFTLTGERLWVSEIGTNTTSIGGEITDLAFDSQDNLIVVGYVRGLAIPNVNSQIDTVFGGVAFDAFVTKFSGQDNSILFSTYLGGTGDEIARAVTVNSSDDIFLCGYTFSDSSSFYLHNPGFPAYFDSVYSTNGDIFITGIHSNGAPFWSTYYGGTDYEQAYDITIDNNDDLFIVGQTYSPDFHMPNPNLQNGFDFNSLQGISDGILITFNNNLSLIWSSYFGGNDVDFSYACATYLNKKFYTTGGTNSSASFPLNNGGGIPYFDNTVPVVGKGCIARFDLNPVINWIGIEEANKILSGLMIYPNPSSENLNVLFHVNNLENILYEVTDVFGRNVFVNYLKDKFGDVRISIPVGSFADGVYILNITVGSQRCNTKFVKL